MLLKQYITCDSFTRF